MRFNPLFALIAAVLLCLLPRQGDAAPRWVGTCQASGTFNYFYESYFNGAWFTEGPGGEPSNPPDAGFGGSLAHSVGDYGARDSRPMWSMDYQHFQDYYMRVNHTYQVTLRWLDENGNPAPNPPKKVLVSEWGTADWHGYYEDEFGDVYGYAPISITGKSNNPIGGAASWAAWVGSYAIDYGNGERWEGRRHKVYDGASGTIVLPAVTLSAEVEFKCTDPVELLFMSVIHGGYFVGTGYNVTVYDLGLDMGRHNGGAGGVATDGSKTHTSSDPTYTRWLPLAFVPHVNTQPFRTDASTALMAPWGNMACAYSIAVRRESQPDRNGAGNYYLPPHLGSTIVAKTSKPGFVITDADGDRLTFDENFTPDSDVKCDVSSTQAGITLSNAGPPGSINERGEYLYVFERVPDADGPNHPYYYSPARLLSISDRHGNSQTLDYGGSLGPGNPYLVVTDHTSNRQIFFYTGANGYISRQVAPAGFGPSAQPAVTTEVLTDGAGHMTRLRVHTGGLSGLLVREELYSYTGDQLLFVTKDGVVEANTYVNSPAKDAFGGDILRLATTRLGSLTDYTSSDDGGTIQGVIDYNWGTVREGYPGLTEGARTNYITDARGNQTKVVYHYANPGTGSDNGAISVIETERPAFTGAAQPYKVKQDYFPDITNPQIATTVDAFQMPWRVEYDTTKRLPVSVRDPLLHETLFTWGGPTGAELLSATDPTGVTTSFSYLPDKSRLTEVKDAAQAVQASVAYNAYGQPENVTAPAATHASGQDSTLQMEYDPTHGDLVRVVTPDGAESLVGQWDPVLQQVVPGSQYDALGDPLAFTVFPDTGNKATSAGPLTTLLQWDAAQQVTGVTLPNGLRLANTYNTQGQAEKAEALAPDNTVLARTEYTYDTRGRLYKTADLLGTTGEVRYDKNSNLRRVIDARGNATEFTYGANDELTQVTTQGGKTSSLLYDEGGRVRETTDARGVRTAYAYDLAGRLQTVSLPDFPGETLTYAYDAAGRLLSVTKPGGHSVVFTYSPPNLWLSSVTTNNGARSHTVSYTYYPDGKRQSMTSTQGGTGKTTTYTWDVSGRLKATSTPGFGTTNLRLHRPHALAGDHVAAEPHLRDDV
jgi:YD repeat-containing protein